jgi:hypothetical protein
MRYWWVCLNDKLWLTEKIPDRLRSRNAVARRPDTFDATSELAQRAGVAFALFVMLTPFHATVDFERWEKASKQGLAKINGIQLGLAVCRCCAHAWPLIRFQAVPADVCRYWHRERQRATESSTFLGTLTWEAYPVPVSGETSTESGKSSAQQTADGSCRARWQLHGKNSETSLRVLDRLRWRASSAPPGVGHSRHGTAPVVSGLG